MGRRKSKRGRGSKPKTEPHTVVPIGCKVPDAPSDIAKEYYKKYGVKFDAASSPVTIAPSSSGGYTSFGSSFKSKTCVHFKQKVTLPEGITILASGTRHHKQGQAWPYPDVGVYFDDGWDDFSDRNRYSTSWKGPKTRGKKKLDAEIAVIDWPDYGVPAEGSMQKVLDTLEYALNQAGEGREVEIGCIGAHGRTGTALAAMLILLGERDADAAMQWVWSNYCVNAIESSKQEDWLWKVAEYLYPEESPQIHKQKIEEAEKKRAEKKPAALPLSSAGGYGQQPKSKSSTNSSGQEVNDYWLDIAAEEYETLVAAGSTPNDAVRYVAWAYDLDEKAVGDYIALLEIEDAEVTNEDEYDEWERVNAAILAELKSDEERELQNYLDPFNGGAYCLLCDHPIKSCECFDGSEC